MVRLLALSVILVASTWVALGGAGAADPCAPAGPGKVYAGCVYDGQDLSGANFSSSGLQRTSWVDATLVDINFSGAVAERANFTGADLTSATMAGGNFARANFTDADLTGADTAGAGFGNAIFCHTIMPNGSINDRNCPA